MLPSATTLTPLRLNEACYEEPAAAADVVFCASVDNEAKDFSSSFVRSNPGLSSGAASGTFQLTIRPDKIISDAFKVLEKYLWL